MTLEILLATRSGDFADAVRLSRACRDWEYATFPEQAEELDAYYEPSRWAAFHRDLPEALSRNDMTCFLALGEGRAVGMCMYRLDRDGSVELRRLFVAPEGRGKRLGARLVEHCLADAKDRGARVARLSTTRFLRHAVALYRDLGFEERPPVSPVTQDADEAALFMEKAL